MKSVLHRCQVCGAKNEVFELTETCEDEKIRDYHFWCGACGHAWYEIWNFVQIGVEAEEDHKKRYPRRKK